MSKKVGKESRPGFLERVLGDKKKAEIEEWVEQGEKILAAAKINRKAYEHRVKGILEDLHAEVAAVFAKFTDDETVVSEAANEAIALVMGKFGGAADEALPEDTDFATEEVEEIMTDETVPEEDEEPVSKAAIMGWIEESSKVHKALTEIMLPALIDNQKAIRSLMPLIERSQRLDALDTMDTRLKELERARTMTPRAASQDAATVIVKDEAALKLETEIKKGVEGEKFELGVKVKS